MAHVIYRQWSQRVRQQKKTTKAEEEHLRPELAEATAINVAGRHSLEVEPTRRAWRLPKLVQVAHILAVTRYRIAKRKSTGLFAGK